MSSRTYFAALIVAPEGSSVAGVADDIRSVLPDCIVGVGQAVPDEHSNGWASAMIDAGTELNVLTGHEAPLEREAE